MKILTSRVIGNSFRTTIACLVLFIACITGQRSSAQAITVTDNPPVMESSEKRFQAAVYPIDNTLRMKVHFVNPDKENVSVIIQDSMKSTVFRKSVGNKPVFHGSFNLESLPDDVYTIIVRCRNNTYKCSISIQTQQARVVHGL